VRTERLRSQTNPPSTLYLPRLRVRYEFAPNETQMTS
jgi:hypothetical protein